jgi:hypothetical protein
VTKRRCLCAFFHAPVHHYGGKVARQEEEGIYFDLNQLRKLQTILPIYINGLHEFGFGVIYMIWLKVNQETCFFCRVSIIDEGQVH